MYSLFLRPLAVLNLHALFSPRTAGVATVESSSSRWWWRQQQRWRRLSLRAAGQFSSDILSLNFTVWQEKNYIQKDDDKKGEAGERGKPVAG